MFEFVHNRKRIVQIVLAIIMLPFAFFGVDSYIRQSGESEAIVARVGDEAISRQELAQAVQQQQERMRSALGAQAKDVLDTPEFKRSVLQNLVQQQVLLNQAREANFTVSLPQLRQTIAEVEAFQEDGKFSQTRYEALLRNRGMTPVSFESRLRRDLLVSQVASGVGETAIEPPALVDRLMRLAQQQREVSQAWLPAEQYLAEVKLEPNAAREYYDSHKAEFEIPEQVRVQYLVLSPDALMSQVEVSDEEVRKQYQTNMAKYEQQEERQASHILVSVAKDADAAAKSAARNRAEELLRKAEQNPQAFAELARKHSQDPGSATQGGDLGSFSRGAMVKPFEDAVFSMKVGEVRGPVESDFGFHVIKLTGVKPAAARGFNQVRDEIRQELKRQKAARKFTEGAENFSNLVFEQFDSLKAAAEAFKLKIEESPWFGKAGPQAGVLKSEKLMTAVFSADAIKERRNTEAVEVAPNTLVSARVLEHKPAALREFEEVKNQITAQLLQRKAAEIARSRGQEKLEALRKGDAAALKWSEPKLISRSDSKDLSQDALAEVFKADASKLPAYVGVPSDKGFRLIKITRVAEPKDGGEQQRSAFKQQLHSLRSQAEFEAYFESIKASTEIKIREGALETR
jgi:peptidyl-prolyl cis-trans isomerase D